MSHPRFFVLTQAPSTDKYCLGLKLLQLDKQNNFFYSEPVTSLATHTLCVVLCHMSELYLNQMRKKSFKKRSDAVRDRNFQLIPCQIYHVLFDL